jgi:hypothetical protein
MLDQLAEYRAEQDAIALRKQELIDAVLTAEIKARLAEIDAEFQEQVNGASANISALEAQIKAAVLTAGATVKGQHLMAVWSKGRVSWDTKMLDGMVKLIPQIGEARKEGDPSVSIRKV